MSSFLLLILCFLLSFSRNVAPSTFVLAPPTDSPLAPEEELPDGVMPPSPPPGPIQPPGPIESPDPIQPPTTVVPSISTPGPRITGIVKKSTSIYSHHNSTKIFGRKLKGYSHEKTYRRGKSSFTVQTGDTRDQRSRGHHKQSFHVYAIPGPQPPVPIVPTAPTPPPLPSIIFTQTTTTTTTEGPPAPLVSPLPLIPGAPAPLLPPQATPANGALAQNIRCATEGRIQRLTATIWRPNGFSSQPVFNDASSINSLSDVNCRMTPMTTSRNQFLVEVNNFQACGVKKQRQGAENREWMALTIRFPFISGLRLAEDEYIMVICRPQDKVKMKNHALDLRGNVARSSKSVFSSGPQNFQCDIGLFRIGTTGSAEKVSSGTAIEIGEKLQLRGEVRKGDGWRFARLTDVVVKRVISTSSNSAGTHISSVNNNVPSDMFRKTITRIQGGHRRKKRSSVAQGTARIYSINRQQSPPLSDVAFLVLSDGCRNPTFKAIAPYHPWRDEKNPLAVNFLFRAFMFQNMKDGDSIRITARVIACVRRQDCQYRTCSDDAGHGFGRRRKRSFRAQGSVEYFNIDKEIYSNGTIRDHTKNNVTNFNENMDVVIVSPGHLQRKLEEKTEEALQWQSSAQHSPSYRVLLVITVISVTAFLISILITILIILKNRWSKKCIEYNLSAHKQTVEIQQQMAVVAAAAAANHSSAFPPMNLGYYNNASESDLGNHDHRVLKKACSKTSVCSNRKLRNCSQKHSLHHCCSSDETESEEDLKCSVV